MIYVPATTACGIHLICSAANVCLSICPDIRLSCSSLTILKSTMSTLQTSRRTPDYRRRGPAGSCTLCAHGDRANQIHTSLGYICLSVRHIATRCVAR